MQVLSRRPGKVAMRASTAKGFARALAVMLCVAAIGGCGLLGPRERPVKPDNLVLGEKRVEATGVAPLTVTQRVKIETTNADRYVNIHGPNIEASFQPVDWGDGTFYQNTTPKYAGFPRHRLRSWQDKATGQIQHELYIAYAYSAASQWQFQTAQLDDASVVPLRVFETQEVECFSERCVRVEHLGVPLSDAFLRSRFYTGFQMHVLSPRGHSAALAVPANYLQGYMTAVDRVRWQQ